MKAAFRGASCPNLPSFEIWLFKMAANWAKELCSLCIVRHIYDTNLTDTGPSQFFPSPFVTCSETWLVGPLQTLLAVVWPQHWLASHFHCLVLIKTCESCNSTPHFRFALSTRDTTTVPGTRRSYLMVVMSSFCLYFHCSAGDTRLWYHWGWVAWWLCSKRIRTLAHIVNKFLRYNKHTEGAVRHFLRYFLVPQKFFICSKSP